MREWETLREAARPLAPRRPRRRWKGRSQDEQSALYSEIAERDCALMAPCGHPGLLEAEILRIRRAPPVAAPGKSRGATRPEVHRATADPLPGIRRHLGDDPQRVGPGARSHDGGSSNNEEAFAGSPPRRRSPAEFASDGASEIPREITGWIP